MQFLDVLPAAGAYCASIGRPTAHKMYASKAELAAALSDVSTDVWVCHAAFLDGGGRRVASNVRAHRSFVFDIDTQEGLSPQEVEDLTTRGKRLYPTKVAALQALKALRTATGLPAPSLVVDSGAGFHAYWTLTTELSTDRWKPIAMRLKALLRDTDPILAGDVTRVADPAGFLRWPGSTNCKAGRTPRAVRVVSTGRPIDVNELLRVLPALSTPTTTKRTKPAFSLGGADDDVPDGDAAITFERCGAMRTYMTEFRTTASYQLWWYALQMMAYSTDPSANAHRVSEGHPGYSADATERMLGHALRYRAEGHAPIRCATFCDEMGLDRATVCAGCPLFSRASSSPINLGLKAAVAPAITPVAAPIPIDVNDHTRFEQAVLAAMAEAPVYGIHNPQIPSWLDPANGGRFQARDDGNLWWVGTQGEVRSDVEDGPSDGSEGEPLEFCFSTGSVWLIQEYKQGDKWFSVFGSRRLEHGRMEYNVTTETRKNINDPKRFEAGLANTRVVFHSSKWAVAARQEFRDVCLAHTERSALATHARLGWTGPKQQGGDFVVGGIKVCTDTVVPITLTGDAMTSQAVEKYHHAGTIAEWTRVLKLYEQHGTDIVKFLLPLGFGSILYTWTGQTAAAVHLGSTATGIGKTAVMTVLTSMFGRPTKGHCKATDTLKAWQNLMGVWASGPVVFEEMTNANAKALDNFGFLIDSGEANNARDAGNTGTLRENTVRWSGLMFSSANMSLHAAIEQHSESGSAAAKQARVFDIDVGHQPLIDTKAMEGDQPAWAVINEIIHNNHGMIGPHFAAYVVKHQEAIRKRVQAEKHRYDRALKTDAHRFWTGILAVGLVANDIMNELGYWSVSRSVYEAIGRRLLVQSMKSVRNTKLRHAYRMREFVEEMVARRSVALWASDRKTLLVEVQHRDEELRAWGVRHTDHTLWYIPKGQLEIWCRQRGIAAQSAVNAALEEGMLIPGADGSIVRKEPILGRKLSALDVSVYVLRVPHALPAVSAAPTPKEPVDAKETRHPHTARLPRQAE